MPTVIGTVTRATGDTIAASPQSSQGNRAAFLARGATGVPIGHYRSAGEAQQAVNLQVGQVLRWVRNDLRGNIEHWVGSTVV
jgi:hypothetical protein